MTINPAQSYDAFKDLARIALDDECTRLLNDGLDHLAHLESRWHPNGFAVFHLNDNHDLGNLRLHIWPDTKRIMRPDGAPIHTHAWHLYSRILSGTYTETIYEESSSETSDSNRYFRGVINYLEDKNSITDCGTSFLKPTVKVEAAKGKCHEVAAGVPHHSDISSRELTATLLITSLPVLETVHVYSLEEITSSSYHRPALTSDEKISLLKRLEQQMIMPEMAE